MFKGGFLEGHKEEVNLDHIDSAAFREVLSYVYTGGFCIDSDNVGCLFGAADFLQYGFIKARCQAFMLDDVHYNTWIQYYKIAEQFQLNDVKKKVTNVIFENFEMVCQCSQFSDLPFEMVYKLLSREDLKCSSENVLLNAILQYLDVNEGLTSEQINNLVNTLRYGLVDSEHLDDLWKLEQFVGAQRVSQISHSITKYDRSGHIKPFLISPPFKPRCPSRMLILGGSCRGSVPSGGTQDCIIGLDLEKTFNNDLDETPSIQRTLPEPLHSFAAVSVTNFVFIIGGQLPFSNISSAVYRYDILRHEWLHLCKMPVRSKGHVAELQGRTIIVVGGVQQQRSEDVDQAASVTTDSVLCYDIENDR